MLKGDTSDFEEELAAERATVINFARIVFTDTLKTGAPGLSETMRTAIVTNAMIRLRAAVAQETPDIVRGQKDG